jgi:deoxyinosine 3'endonuclease (endonuclease V)
VSIGHPIDLATATGLVLRLRRGNPLAETTRLADRRCRDALEILGRSAQP